MQIVHLTSVHSRYDTRVFLKECRSLAAVGHDVTLVVADGRGDERRDGVAIIDVGKPTSRINRMLRTVNRVFCAATALDADTYHLHDPELLRIALRLKSLRGGSAKVVYDAHEDYVKQISIKSYLPRPLSVISAGLFGRFERYVAHRIDGVIVVMDQQIRSFGKYAKRCAIVPNFVDLSHFPQRVVNFDRARILHAGSLSDVRGLREMIKLADCMGARGDIAFAGPLHRSTSEAGLGSARYLGVLGESDLLEEYARSNIGLILYRPVGQYGRATAVKVYEYMAASMPIIVPDHGDWPALVQRAKCGLAVNVDDVGQQISAVDFLLSNPRQAREMGRNGRDYALAHASWAVAFKAMAEMYESILKEN